jgi:hypothetical protein
MTPSAAASSLYARLICRVKQVSKEEPTYVAIAKLKALPATLREIEAATRLHS